MHVRAVVALAAGEAGGQQRFSKFGYVGDMNGAAIESRALSALGGEELIAHGIVNDGSYESAVFFRLEVSRTLFKAHGNAELRKPVRKVGGPVERIDIPAELAFHTIASAFFAVDAVLGKDFAEPSADEFFNCAVRDGDQIDVALVFSFDALSKKFAQALSTFTRDF